MRIGKARFPPLSDQPLKDVRQRRLRIRTTVGEIEIKAPYGQDPETGEWLFPIRVLWGLDAKEKTSPVLAEKLCLTATSTFSYERAARVARVWGTPTDDSTIHCCVQKSGEEAEQLCEQRVERALSVDTRSEVVVEAKEDLPAGPFSLVVMMDGWMARERGPQWGLKPPGKEANRVEWHEMKSAIVFRLDQRVETRSGRRMVLEKFYVSYRGDPYEFGRRVYAEALRRGLTQAKRVYVVADGGVWIWNIVEDRFPEATAVLDFYHASEHLWAVAREIHDDDEEARRWVEPLLHQLNHGGEAGVLKSLEDLLQLCADLKEDSAKLLKREVKYYQTHRDHIHYKEVESQGCPKGSGAMESTCSQFQDRFKRTGQFWSVPGKEYLMALELADRNGDWDEIWEVHSQQT